MPGLVTQPFDAADPRLADVQSLLPLVHAVVDASATVVTGEHVAALSLWSGRLGAGASVAALARNQRFVRLQAGLAQGGPAAVPAAGVSVAVWQREVEVAVLTARLRESAGYVAEQDGVVCAAVPRLLEWAYEYAGHGRDGVFVGPLDVAGLLPLLRELVGPLLTQVSWVQVEVVAAVAAALPAGRRGLADVRSVFARSGGLDPRVGADAAAEAATVRRSMGPWTPVGGFVVDVGGGLVWQRRRISGGGGGDVAAAYAAMASALLGRRAGDRAGVGVVG
jgi:hypothetical protein